MDGCQTEWKCQPCAIAPWITQPHSIFHSRPKTLRAIHNTELMPKKKEKKRRAQSIGWNRKWRRIIFVIFGHRCWCFSAAISFFMVFFFLFLDGRSVNAIAEPWNNYFYLLAYDKISSQVCSLTKPLNGCIWTNFFLIGLRWRLFCLDSRFVSFAENLFVDQTKPKTVKIIRKKEKKKKRNIVFIHLITFIKIKLKFN